MKSWHGNCFLEWSIREREREREIRRIMQSHFSYLNVDVIASMTFQFLSFSLALFALHSVTPSFLISPLSLSFLLYSFSIYSLFILYDAKIILGMAGKDTYWERTAKGKTDHHHSNKHSRGAMEGQSQRHFVRSWEARLVNFFSDLTWYTKLTISLNESVVYMCLPNHKHDRISSLYPFLIPVMLTNLNPAKSALSLPPLNHLPTPFQSPLFPL